MNTVAASVELVETENLATKTLDELAELAVDEHRQVEQDLVSALNHAFRLGEVLLAAFERLEPGEWEPWIESTGMSTSTARNFQRLARYRDQLPREIYEPHRAKNGAVIQPSYSRALVYLKGLPPVRTTQRKREVTSAMREEGLRLLAAGTPYAAVADLLGVSDTTVRDWGNPAKFREREQRRRARLRQQRRARNALKEQDRRSEIDALASAHGGELAKSYALVRRLAQSLDRASTTFDRGATQRGYLGVALAATHKAEDEIVRALRYERISDGS